MTRLALALLVALVAACPAAAHPPPLGLRGFVGGALHPLFVADHAIAVLAMGLLAGGQTNGRWAALMGFALGLAGGLLTMTTGVVPQWANETVLAMAVAVGLLTALARPMPVLPLAALALVLGAATGLDSPPEVLSVGEANRMLAGTGLGGMGALAGVIGLRTLLRGQWPETGARILASWIAAAAILTLALRLLR